MKNTNITSFMFREEGSLVIQDKQPPHLSSSSREAYAPNKNQYLNVRKQSVQHNSGGEMENSKFRTGRFFSVAEEGTPKDLSRRHSSLAEDDSE